MTKTVQEMIAAGESEALEFKATFNKEAIESISAFANHKGGKVLLGIKDSDKETSLADLETDKISTFSIPANSSVI